MKTPSFFVFISLVLLFSCSNGAYETQDRYLYPVVLNERWGFIDQDGLIAIKPQFSWADTFSEGLARVILDTLEKEPTNRRVDEPNRKWRFIDSTGNVVLTSDTRHVSNFSEGLAEIWGADTIKYIDKTGRVVKIRAGLKDKAGNWIKTPTIDRINRFSEGLAPVQVDTLWGYIDTTGKMAITPRFDQAWPFSEGVAVVHVGGRNDAFRYPEPGRWRFIDKTGNFIDDTTKFEAHLPFSEGLAAVKVGRNYSFVDKYLNLVFSPKFCQVQGFHDGLAIVSPHDACPSKGCIDKSGRFVIEPIFDVIENFHGPLARACRRDSVGKFQFGYINRKGEWVFKDDLKIN